MSYQARPRPAALSGIDKTRNKPLPKAQPLEKYRALHGEKIRQYYAVGDPVQHMRSVAGNRRIALVLGGILLAVVVIVIFAGRR